MRPLKSLSVFAKLHRIAIVRWIDEQHDTQQLIVPLVARERLCATDISSALWCDITTVSQHLQECVPELETYKTRKTDLGRRKVLLPHVLDKAGHPTYLLSCDKP